MGAREDLLDAARRLARRGRSPFSPADLIADARAAGSNYPDATLRTFVVGPMCLNSPDNHAVQYGDLVRVGRGAYRLATLSDAPGATTDRPEAPVTRGEPKGDAPEAAWFWEGNVQAAVVRHLAAEGWHIRRVADTASRERGVDIEADHGGVRLLVEVKGYPAATYARGKRAGQEPTPAPLQARAYFSNALLSGVLMRSENEDDRVALAFPAMETYSALATRCRGPLASAGIELWLVDDSGGVRPVDEH
jgi:hypothetical protein